MKAGRGYQRFVFQGGGLDVRDGGFLNEIEGRAMGSGSWWFWRRRRAPFYGSVFARTKRDDGKIGLTT